MTGPRYALINEAIEKSILHKDTNTLAVAGLNSDNIDGLVTVIMSVHFSARPRVFSNYCKRMINE